MCGSERRDGFIIARIEHRKAGPSHDGKKDRIKMFDNKDLLKGYLFFLNGSDGQYYDNIELLTKE